MRYLLPLLLALGHSALAALQMPPLFSDHMVVQAGEETNWWGTAAAGQGVTVTFLSADGGKLAEAGGTAGADGTWSVKLPTVARGAAGRVEVRAGGEVQKTIADVIAGEVWLGSGQSNMEYNVAAANVPKEVSNVAVEEAKAAQPRIRFFQVAKIGADAPSKNYQGQWFVVTPETVGQCSAIAWYFAQELNARLQAPVGMITSCWGGTPVEAWLPKEAIDGTPSAEAVWKRHHDLLAKYPPEKVKELQEASKKWTEENPTPELKAKNAKTKPEVPYWKTASGVPTRLYNGMIYGLAPYTLQGVLWYQGEANGDRPQLYADLIRALITRWRQDFGKELPFYYVELAGLKPKQSQPVESGWGEIREAQAGALKLPKTGVATAIDHGLPNDIHPYEKKPVGQRLAGLALADVYGVSGPDPRSPEFAGYKIEGDKVRISLAHADGLRVRGGEPIRGFAIQGGGSADWKWAEAKIEGSDVVVWNAQIAAPAAVRYGWAGNPLDSLENASGLPLRPFRTDSPTAAH